MNTIFLIYNGALSALLSEGSLPDGIYAGLLSPELAALLQNKLSESPLETIAPDAELPSASEPCGYLCTVSNTDDLQNRIGKAEGHTVAVVAKDAYLLFGGSIPFANGREDLVSEDSDRDADRFFQIAGVRLPDEKPDTTDVPPVGFADAQDSTPAEPSDDADLPVPSESADSAELPAETDGEHPDEQWSDRLFDEIESEKPAKVAEKKSLVSSIFDWFEVFCVAMICVLVLVSFVARQSPVEGSSMYPTLVGHSAGGTDPEHGLDSGYDVLLISNLFYTPKRSDIVIIQEPSQLSEPIVKRIIALEGDTVRINFTTWEVSVNGETLDEDYVNLKNIPLSSQSLPVDQNNCWEGTVPEGCIFVLGDNRAVSKDSRTFGYIDERYIIGKVVLRISPFSRFGTVED
ncbi:MAG: signal peptidase I [Eubacteriales bacterium]